MNENNSNKFKFIGFGFIKVDERGESCIKLSLKHDQINHSIQALKI